MDSIASICEKEAIIRGKSVSRNDQEASRNWGFLSKIQIYLKKSNKYRDSVSQNEETPDDQETFGRILFGEDSLNMAVSKGQEFTKLWSHSG